MLGACGASHRGAAAGTGCWIAVTVPKALKLEGLAAPQRAAGRAAGPAGRLFWIFRISGRIEAVQKPDRPAHLSARSLGARAVIARQNDFSPPGD